ncbi:MAG: tetratricopeptide repeat protein [Bacteroidales bacterium]|nr:tetratricopeptide repeat protein [Bacteroidales bacterium]
MKVSIKYITIIFFSLVFFDLFGQNQLEKQVIQLKDSALIEFKNENFNKSIEYISKALSYTSQISNKELEGDCNLLSAEIFLKNDDKKTAFQYFLRSASNYKKTGNTSKISNIYYKIALICFNSKAYNKSLIYFNLCDSIKPKSEKTYLFNQKIANYIGDSYFRTKKYDSAAGFFMQNYNNSLSKKDTANIILSLNKLIQISKKKGLFRDAVKHNNELYSIYESQNDFKKKAVIQNNIGYLYVRLKENQSALNAFKKADEESNNADTDNKFSAITHTNIGICLQNKGDYDESIVSFIKAREICEIDSNYRQRAIINNIIALVYYQKDDLYNATEYSIESIEDAEKSEDKVVLKNNYRTYSTILQALDDFQKALDFYKKHLEIRDSLLVEKRISEQMMSQRIYELENSEKELHLKLADEEVKDMLLKQMKLEAEKREQDLKLANKERELAKSEKETALKTLALEMQKRNALFKEQQIKNLEHDKAIQNLVLKQKEIKEKHKQKEIKFLKIKNEKKQLTIEKQEDEKKRFLWTFGFVLVILALIIYSLISARRKNIKLKAQKEQIEHNNDELNQQNEEITSQKEYLEKANKQITDQKIEIERTNEEITDSIKYAERIQKAVLPAIDLKAAGLSDYFIFYKPKDIVSGDFYWIKRIGFNVVIAIADCTGHGVPGAFMSMLGISSLNEVITKTRFDNAGRILDRLRNKVKKSLGQTGKELEQKDGMDMVLIIIDTENMKLQYAGANNPLMRISDGTVDLIKADRMPIGIHHNEPNFHNHIIDIKKGDLFYAYSDGFQDQFGGEKGRKYMSKRFRNMLFEIHEKPMSEQEEILKTTLSKWQSYKDKAGNTFEQVDDILIVGVKI